MGKLNYKKVLKQLVEEFPHELDKIEKVYTDARKSLSLDAYISYEDIITSNVWNVDEKVRLFNIFGYNKNEHSITIEKDNTSIIDYEYMMKNNLLDSFEALMKTYKQIERHYVSGLISKDESYKRIFRYVISYCNEKNKSIYLRKILENLTDEDIRRLIAPSYEAHYLAAVHDESIFVSIIASKDINLIKEYISYIEDINMYFQEAVLTGKKEIVDLFIEKGADVNYLTNEVITGRLTPLKAAIVNNDYEMFKYLIEKGADVNIVFSDENFFERIKNHQIKISWGHFILERALKVKGTDYNQLKYIRSSTPLEFACKFSDEKYLLNPNSSDYMLYFNGRTCYVENSISVKPLEVTNQVKNRAKIIDLILEKMNDKKKINFTDLISFAFGILNSERIKSYTKMAFENNGIVDFDILFHRFYIFDIYRNKDMYQEFINYIGKYDEDGELYLKLFDYYLKHVVKTGAVYSIREHAFAISVLNKIPVDKRKNICLVPYCKDLKTLKTLLNLGFDINQVDENGRTIMYYLLCNRFSNYYNFHSLEQELFDYLLDNLDLTINDNEGKDVVYYALKAFKTKDEYQFAKKENIGTRTELEKLTTRLISKIPKDKLCINDIISVLEQRTDYDSIVDKIHYEFIYQHHEELFNVLIDKGVILSDKILESIFNELYNLDHDRVDRLKEKIDYDKTLEFLYEKLDRNTMIQRINMDQEFENFISSMTKNEMSFEEFLKVFKKFNSLLIKLKIFYKKNILKRYDPEKYLDYAKKKYGVNYKDLDSYITLIIIRALRIFGSDKLTRILEMVPNYNINNYVIEEDIGYNYWTYLEEVSNIVDYDENGNPIYSDDHFEADYINTDSYDNIRFTGGLIQYAILTNNLEMVKELQEKGASLKLMIDGEDSSWDYVNSHTMQEYIESIIGKKEYSDLDSEEKDYYMSLINSNNQVSKKLVPKKED